jgi:hypothetical protein
MNQSAAIPTDLRYDVRIPSQKEREVQLVPPNTTPQKANDLMAEYTSAVKKGVIPHLDLHIVREQIEERLAEQGVQPLEVTSRLASSPRPRKPSICNAWTRSSETASASTRKPPNHNLPTKPNSLHASLSDTWNCSTLKVNTIGSRHTPKCTPLWTTTTPNR